MKVFSFPPRFPYIFMPFWKSGVVASMSVAAHGIRELLPSTHDFLENVQEVENCCEHFLINYLCFIFSPVIFFFVVGSFLPI